MTTARSRASRRGTFCSRNEGRRRVAPVRLRRGELTVEVSSSPLFHELRSFTGNDFRKNANRKLGADTIRRVTFKLRG